VYHEVGMSTLLCVPIMVQDEPTALSDAQCARDAGADLVEYRIDELFSGSTGANGGLVDNEVNVILRLVGACPLPCVVTCRCKSEGGSFDGDEMARVALFERLGTAGGPGAKHEHPPKYIDIEFASYSRSANLKQKVNLAVDHPGQQRDVRTGLILSMHDFQGRPTDLLRRVSSMALEPAARIIKVAIMARSVRDNLELFDLLIENASDRPMIALAMGKFGLLSRVLAPKFGGFLTFASLGKQLATAPGQPTVNELLDQYRFRNIRPTTRVYGLIGDPLEHSLSPLVHNAGFEALVPDSWDEGDAARAVDGVYVPLPVPEGYEHFKASLSSLIDHVRLDFCGCSVTLPHKQNLVRYARERMSAGDDEYPWTIDTMSEIAGSANTLVVTRDSLGIPTKASVVNTDAPAAVASLAVTFGGDGVAGKTIGIIGAGGVARAVAAGLCDAGAQVVVMNRTHENATKLVEDLREKFDARGRAVEIMARPLADITMLAFDAIVNCTSVGMTGGPAPKDSPISIEDLRKSSPDAVVMDTVYAPLRTPLLEQAHLAGLRTIEGLDMFVCQAGMQFEQWTGHAPPLRLFDRVCREAVVEQR
jgi:3-dehydroquinate dehydratase/shikimate dehydrogenase